MDWILSVHHDPSWSGIRYKRLASAHCCYWNSWNILYGWILVSKQNLAWYLVIDTKQFFQVKNLVHSTEFMFASRVI